MAKVTLPGVIVTIILFLLLSALVASQIQVTLPYITEPTSLLHSFWATFVSWLREIL